MAQRYAAWQAEGSAASAGDDAVLKAVLRAGAICSSRRGIGRAAAHKSARQNTVEAQTQEISTIAMAQSEALAVPPAGGHALAQRKKVRQPTNHAKPNP